MSEAHLRVRNCTCRIPTFGQHRTFHRRCAFLSLRTLSHTHIIGRAKASKSCIGMWQLVLLAMSTVFALGESAVSASVSPLTWNLETKGFHTKLHVTLHEHELVLAPGSNLTIDFDLLSTFFLDAFEVEQQTDIFSSQHQNDASKRFPFRLAKVISTFPFDIEAPTFTTSYTSNHVQLVVRCASEDNESCIARGGLRLETPIHLRYEVLDTTTPLRLLDLLIADSYVHRCSPASTLQAQWPGRGKPVVSTGADLCADVPVGILSHLPFVYWCTMALLVGAAGWFVLSL